MPSGDRTPPQTFQKLSGGGGGDSAIEENIASQDGLIEGDLIETSADGFDLWEFGHG